MKILYFENQTGCRDILIYIIWSCRIMEKYFFIIALVISKTNEIVILLIHYIIDNVKGYDENFEGIMSEKDRIWKYSDEEKEEILLGRISKYYREKIGV